MMENFKKKKFERWFRLIHLYQNKLKGQNECSFQFAQIKSVTSKNTCVDLDNSRYHKNLIQW